MWVDFGPSARSRREKQSVWDSGICKASSAQSHGWLESGTAAPQRAEMRWAVVLQAELVRDVKSVNKSPR